MVEHRSVKPEVESSNLSGIADNSMLIVSKEEKKGMSRAEDLYAKYGKYRQPFSFLLEAR